ncbi:MAG: hypothetical protein J6A62_03800 [Oscillospiraceae bacterium]|nr:hypothetical protein [Oscillospiraceae bacterium]
MKKIVLMALVLSILVVPMTGKVSADDHVSDTLPPVIVQPDSPDVQQGFLPGSVPADSSVMDAIQLPINALVLSMAEHGLVYDANSDDFVWNALYYALNMYGQADDRAQLDGDTLMLPSESAQDFLCALFAGRSQLPALPDALADRVGYDALTDQFCLTVGDVGLAETVFEQPVCSGDGLYAVDGSLTNPEDGAVLCTFRVELAENESMFGFSILNVVLN